MDDRSPSMLKPTLISGTLFGVLAGLPLLHYVNYCTCCTYHSFSHKSIYFSQFNNLGINFHGVDFPRILFESNRDIISRSGSKNQNTFNGLHQTVRANQIVIAFPRKGLFNNIFI